MTGKIKSRPYWTYACDSCMACMNYCPARAVEASPLLAFVFYYLATIPAATYLLGSFSTEQAASLLQYVYMLLSVYLAYLFLHTALGWRAFSIILGRLSHTFYFRRYHAPDVAAKEFYNK